MVGWNQLFMGRFVWGWSDHQVTYQAIQPVLLAESKEAEDSKWQQSLASYGTSGFEVGCFATRSFMVWTRHSQRAQTGPDRREALRKLREVYDLLLRYHYEPSARGLLSMDNITAHQSKRTDVANHELACHPRTSTMAELPSREEESDPPRNEIITLVVFYYNISE